MLDQILAHDALVELKDVRVGRVHTRAQPMHVRIAEGFDAREIFQTTLAFASEQRLVDPEVMTVAVNQHDRLLKALRFLFECVKEFIKAGAELVRAGQVEMRIGLDNEHHRAEIALGGGGKALPQPREVRTVASRKFGLAEIIRAARDVESREENAPINPADV